MLFLSQPLPERQEQNSHIYTTASLPVDAVGARGSATHPESGADRGQGRPLVYNSISHRTPSNLHTSIPSDLSNHLYQVYNQDLYLVKYGRPEPPRESKKGCRKEIESFSDKSERRLDFVARNSGHRIKSQFSLTYHEQWPTSGRVSKRHLDTFLKVLRRRGIGYLWILEFQTRFAPHYHLFLDTPVSRSLQRHLAKSWVRITEGTPQQLRFHLHRKNFIPWKMTSGDYLVKQYCSKTAQKLVPSGYSGFGRFWGNSRELKPIPSLLTPAWIASATQNNVIPWLPGSVERFVYRCLRRYHEKKLRFLPRKVKSSIARPCNGAFRVPGGSSVLYRLFDYIVSHGPDPYSYRSGLIKLNPAPF